MHKSADSVAKEKMHFIKIVYGKVAYNKIYKNPIHCGVFVEKISFFVEINKKMVYTINIFEKGGFLHEKNSEFSFGVCNDCIFACRMRKFQDCRDTGPNHIGSGRERCS